MGSICVTALLAVALVPHLAQAQIAAAIGKPLPSPDLPIGTVSVRVVAGAPSSPVTGTEVTLVVNGATRVARTDSAGRAHFKDLPPNAKIQAKVTDEDKKEITSDEFELPADSGVRLMLTTLPWNPGAGGAGPMAGGGGMPNPRQMSGEPRPEGNDAPGTLTVRLSYDDFKDAPPIDVPVVLVGYGADNSVTLQTVKSDKEGRAAFKGLDRTGATSYFAMTQLPRNNAVDRLMSTPVVLDPRGGVRMILSSEKRTSTAPAIDDLGKTERQDGAPAAGKVRVALEGGPDANATVTLVDAEQKLVIARGKPGTGAPDPSDVQAQASFDDKTDVPAGTLRVKVHGGSTSDDPMAGVKARIVLASNTDTTLVEGATDANGVLELKTTATEPIIAAFVLNGKEMSSKPLDLTKKGGSIEITARWPSEGKPEVMFDLTPRPGQVVYAETMMHGQTYRSLPFQPLADRGSRVSLYIFPRVVFKFMMRSQIDDEYLAVNGRFEVSNYSWAPYVGGTDGVLLPLPKGFVGGLVADKDQGDVAIAPGEGFRIVRPIAPGGRTFHGAFSLPNENGEVKWAMDLPFGAFDSEMGILQVPGMHVETPPGVNGQTVTVPDGTYFVLPQLSIMPKQSMVMTITGLPAPAAWRTWMPRIIGMLVVIVMIAGVTFALNRKTADREADAARQAKRQKLLDELVEIERTGKNEKRREQIMAELEQLWDDAA